MSRQQHDGNAAILLAQRSGIFEITLNRPDKHNALDAKAYAALASAFLQAGQTDDVRVLTIRGAGGRAFSAGTDIGEFAAFTSAEDGLAYERRVTSVLNALEAVPVPTAAVIDGYCLGAGLAVAAACDIRIATPDSMFGVPIARTAGNCLSAHTQSLLSHRLGPARTLDMLVRARLMAAQEAHSAGFIGEVVASDQIESAVLELTGQLAQHAQPTMRAARETDRRIRETTQPCNDDIVREVYGSKEFEQRSSEFAGERST